MILETKAVFDAAKKPSRDKDLPRQEPVQWCAPLSWSEFSPVSKRSGEKLDYAYWFARHVPSDS